MPTLGEILREEREKAGLTTSQVAEVTRIKIQRVEDIENDDFSQIAATIYGKGFVRLYADLLKLDPQPLVELYMEQVGESSAPVLTPKGRRRRTAGPDSVAGESMDAEDRRQILDDRGGSTSGARATRRPGNERHTPGILAPLHAAVVRVIQALPVQPRTESAGGNADGQEGSAQALQRTVMANWPMIATLVLVVILIASSMSRCIRGENSGETGVSTAVRPLPFAEDPPEPLMD